MFCIDTANNWASNDLSRSPYSKANGGPCENTADYFNLPEARAMTREKTKYVAARWGYSPAIWCWEFWDGYIHKHDLYPHYRGIANFLKEERWHERETLPLMISMGQSHSRELDPPRDMKVPTTLSGSDFYRSRFSIDGGGWRPYHLIPNTWYGSDRVGLQFRAIFRVEYPVAGQFIPMVWGGGNNTNGIVSDAGAPAGEPLVEIRLDGKVALRRPVVVTKPKGSTDLYCDRLAIDVPEGVHEIEMCNVGQGQFITGHLLLTNFQTMSRRYSAQGLHCGDRCAFWIYNRDYQWETAKAGRAVEPIQDAELLFFELTPGTYDLQWWDTQAGQVTECERVSVGDDGALKVRVPVFVNDIAGKLVPMR